ncbi:MAG: hypothetical protein LBC83_02335 [Oscillospiraceae bacterium]|jgi:hypothetical protein|nr:hypothetical protein [Oscillospiraceae bacterium]
MDGRFAMWRNRHPVFHYNGFRVAQEPGLLRLRWDFAIDHLCEFHPETVVFTENLHILNDPNGVVARRIAFALGLVEAISYWKCVCPPEVLVHCGAIAPEDVAWWKRLWLGGLGEFFYRNGIETNEADFVCLRSDFSEAAAEQSAPFRSGAVRTLVPVGGGKDSCVTLELLRAAGTPLMGFAVNDQPARGATFAAAGFAPKQMLRAKRTIDPALLRLNTEGYWNGHTPFSAVVAFLGLYCAHLVGAENIVLSNEASADEASVPGTEVNHQYSKSYAFEQDMNRYIGEYFGLPLCYFSLLRPFHELQIACRFAALPQFHAGFRSCNVGSKANAWCGRCAKCLFVWLMLSPFLSQKELVRIFGSDLGAKPSLAEELRGLLGLRCTKPFECVGTVEEARAALTLTLLRFEQMGESPPPLLQAAPPECRLTPERCAGLLRDFRAVHAVPQEFETALERMKAFVGEIAGVAGA